MKTENLTQLEAYRALVDGHLVKSASGYIHKFQDDVIVFEEDDEWTVSENALGNTPPYSIVVPEQKSLSFEEAVSALMDGKTVAVKESYRKYMGSRLEGHTVLNVCYLDLADRKEWKMVEVTE